MPNFKGAWGLAQKLWYPENLKVHNLKCMNLKYLNSILEGFPTIANYKVYYYGTFNTHIENFKTLSYLNKKTYKLYSLLIKNFSKYPHWKTFIAPHIVIEIKMKEHI